MAYFNQLPSGLWRAQVAIKGTRKTKSFKSRADAVRWAAHTEQAIRTRHELRQARHELLLATLVPRRVIDARERIDFTEPQIIEGAYPAECLTGVYFLIKDRRVVYVGQSVNVFRRISRHKDDGKDFDAFNYILCTPDRLDQVESDYITALLPDGNWSL